MIEVLKITQISSGKPNVIFHCPKHALRHNFIQYWSTEVETRARMCSPQELFQWRGEVVPRQQSRRKVFFH